MPQFEGQELQSQLQLKDVSEKTSLINPQEDVSEICKSALFDMSLRRYVRRLKDASKMHPCQLRCN